MICPTVMRGLSDEYGSWKITWILRRTPRMSAWFAWVMSAPPKRIEPAVASSSLSTARPTVVLPQPDSPTSPSVSPAMTWIETSSTAFTVAVALERNPAPAAFTVKYFFR